MHALSGSTLLWLVAGCMHGPQHGEPNPVTPQPAAELAPAAPTEPPASRDDAVQEDAVQEGAVQDDANPAPEQDGVYLRSLFQTSSANDAPVGRLAIQIVEDTGWRTVSVDHAFRVGDRIRIEFEASRAGYAYLFNTPASGGQATALIWPPAGQALRIEPHRSLVVPDAGTFRITGDGGEEYNTLLLSPDPLTASRLDLYAKGLVYKDGEVRYDECEALQTTLAAATQAAALQENQAARPVGESAESAQVLENIYIRGNCGTRQIVWDPPQQDDDMNRYFTTSEADGRALVHFVLRPR